MFLAKVATLVPGGSANPNAVDLRASWGALLKHLFLIEPAPATRACPSCGGTIMLAATRCMHCWVQSTPPET
jgi:hypothetical protein